MTPKEARSGLTQEKVRLLFHYDPETGVLTRIAAGHTSQRFIGETAGSINRTNGYVNVKIGTNNGFRAHRLIWLYVHGLWPQHDLDHINGIRHDNRLCNLREATRAQNVHNASCRKTSISGIKGVSWDNAKACWITQVYRPDGTKYLGCFESKEDAAKAYRLEAQKAFGAFARPARIEEQTSTGHMS